MFKSEEDEYDGEATNDVTGLRFVVTVKHYSRSIIACASVVMMALHICSNHVKHAGGTMCVGARPLHGFFWRDLSFVDVCMILTHFQASKKSPTFPPNNFFSSGVFGLCNSSVLLR